MKAPLSLVLGLVIGLVLGGGLGLASAVPAVASSPGTLEVEIRQPESGTVLIGSEDSIEVRGGASVFGGVKQLDLFLVLDTSSSLKNTDPKDYRVSGAIGLVESLPEWSDIQTGVVAFGRGAKLLAPLSADRGQTVAALRELGRGSTTNLARGIDTALEGFAQGARPGSTRVMLVFTDGRSNEKKARAATERAKAQGIVIHTLMLGRDHVGQKMLREIANGTGGGFLSVTDPAQLPAAFLDLRTAGVEGVTLSVNGSEPVPTRLTLGRYSGQVPLEQGENVIVATVTSRDGRTRSESVSVMVRPEGCGELAIQAVRDGESVLSLSDRSVEIVMDASRSMWGQLEGEAKMAIAKQMLDDALDWLPKDVKLSLRVYGHRHAPAARDCKDTELLVAPGSGSREEIRAAIASLRPKGQTPLGYALEQIGEDFESVRGERAVVLVTDGIESCGGNAPAAAHALQAKGPVPVHVIGFGMADASDEDLASLRAIADASGGRFVTASSARELEKALMTTVGTSFRVSQQGVTAASGTLGSDDLLRLPAGEYRVHLESDPPRQASVALESEVRHTVVFDASQSGTPPKAWREETQYSSCEAQAADLAEARRTAPAHEPPAAPAAASTTQAAESGASARREARFDVDGGSVELWQNLRADRKADWGVVVRHPSVGSTPRMIYSGNDRSLAAMAAEKALESLRSGRSLDE